MGARFTGSDPCPKCTTQAGLSDALDSKELSCVWQQARNRRGVAKDAKIVGQRGSGRLTVQTEWGQREHFLHLYANTRNKATEASEGVPPAALIISHDWRRLLPGMRTYILCDRAASRRVKERRCRGGLAARSARDHTACRRLYRVKNEQEVGTPFINRVREEVGGHRSEGYDGPGRA